MKTLLQNLLTKLRTSLWFVPLLMALAAAGLEAWISQLDGGPPHPSLDAFSFLYASSPSGAQAILTAIATSMIGVTGVVFSITIVALQLASTQFGPRILRNFMKDRANQFVLGTFIATFIFCLLALRRFDPGSGQTAHLTVAVALALTLGSLGVLIYFIHHISTGIQADTIVAHVWRDLEESIAHLYPTEMGENATDEATPAPPDGFDQEAVAVHADASGYVQAIDHAELLRLAATNDLVLRLQRAPGDFAATGSLLVSAWPASSVDGKLAAALRRAFILGRQRTEEQDVEFSVDQLVEVAVRSLSPGINDPFTALTCVDRLGAAFCRLATREIPSRHRLGEDGRLRVIVARPGFEAIIHNAFDPIRQYARGSVPVTLRLLDTLALIGRRCPPSRRRVLRTQAQRTLETSQLVTLSPSDERAIRRRYQSVVRVLKTKPLAIH